MRSTRKSRVWAGGLLVAALTVTGCAAGGAEEDASAPEPTIDESGLEDMEPIVLTYSDSNVETAAHVAAMQKFMETVEKETEGKITFETYYAASLHPVTESLSAIQSGLTDITFVSPSNVPESMPVALWETTLSQSAIESQFPMSLIQGTPVQFAAYQDGPLAEELAAFDAMTLATWGTAPNSLMCKTQEASAADAQGKLVRTPGPPHIYEVEALGMSNVTLPVTDVFEGLQRGVIDCFMNVVSPFITLGVWDEAKYFIPAEFATSAGSQLLMSKSTFESLPIAAQRIIFDARIGLLVDILEATLARNVQFAEEAPGKGVVFVDPSTYNVKIAEAREKYTADAVAAPPAGVSDGAAFADDLASLADEWDAAAADLDIESGSPSSQEDWIDLYLSVKDIDWDAYASVLREYLAPFRP